MFGYISDTAKAIVTHFFRNKHFFSAFFSERQMMIYDMMHINCSGSNAYGETARKLIPSEVLSGL